MTHQVDIKYLLRDIAHSLSRRVDFEEADDATDILETGWYALLHCAALVIGQLQSQLILDQRVERELAEENKKLRAELIEQKARFTPVRMDEGIT